MSGSRFPPYSYVMCNDAHIIFFTNWGQFNAGFERFLKDF